MESSPSNHSNALQWQNWYTRNNGSIPDPNRYAEFGYQSQVRTSNAR